jgi:hypothetical protein
MRFFMLISAVGMAVAAFAPPCPAAPQLGDKPVRFEYAELQFRATTAARIVIGRVGGAAPAPPAAAAEPTVRWTTGDDEFLVKGWEELAEKLKAPSPKKADATVTMHKLRVLNKLGAEGWEMVEHTGTDGTSGLATWTFKRRLP